MKLNVCLCVGSGGCVEIENEDDIELVNLSTLYQANQSQVS